MSNHLVYQPGSVIKARKRLWRVDYHKGNELGVTTLEGETEQQRLYIPFENIEPGELNPPNPGIVGFPQSHDLLIQAFRLSLIHSTAPLLSIQRSRAIPTNYQIIPVVMALEMPRVRMLIADDVGLGKTIEAGLIITELLSRQRIQRVLIVCPANLREQWREALDYFFHIRARIISTRHRREMERELPAGASPWEFFNFLITSIDYAKTPAIRNQILEQSWDLMLIDEAHNAAKPHQTTEDEKVIMERWILAEKLAKKATNLLLLTATPHNGYTDSYASLIRMLDVGTVSGPVHRPVIDRDIAKKHVCQRRRKDVEEWFKSSEGVKSPFPIRDTTDQEVSVKLTDIYEKVMKSVREYGDMVIESAEGVQKRHTAYWTALHLQKRGLSSPHALRKSFENRLNVITKRIKETEIIISESTIPDEIAKDYTLDFDPGERFDDEEAGRRVERVLYGTLEELEKEKEQLLSLINEAKKITLSNDSKLKKLLDYVLPNRLRVYPKVLIFTKYKDTLDYLEKNISDWAKKKDLKVYTLDGSLIESQRRERFKQFEHATQAVMIATDCISEGINLQHACAQIIHYELPWNPNRLEQRNGRIDRYGQKEKTVYIRTMVTDDRLDALILRVLVLKADEIRKEYGFSPPYFGDDASILDLIKDQGFEIPIDTQLTIFDQQRIGKESKINPFSEESIKKIQEESFYGQTDVDFPDIQTRLEETHRLIGKPEDIHNFVESSLNRFQCKFVSNNDGTFRIVLNNEALRGAALKDIIEHATFDPSIGLDDPDVEVLDLGHPLVRRLIELVKQSAFIENEDYGRTSVLFSPSINTPTAFLYYLVRYAVHTDPMSIIEELFPISIPIYNGGFHSLADTYKIMTRPASTKVPTENESKEALNDIMNNKNLEDGVKNIINDRCQLLSKERKEFKEKLELQSSKEIMEWLNGIDNLTVASYDLLTCKILLPE